jgi:hypothetical protein
MQNTGSESAHRLLILVLLLVLPLPSVAQSMSQPAVLQIPVLLKVLTYDRHFETKSAQQVMVGIVYVDSRESRAALEDVAATLKSFAGKTVKTRPVNYVVLEYTSPADLEKAIKAKNVNVLYITPGNDKNLADVLKISQANSITTLTGVPEYVKRSPGIAVGVGLRADKKPQIYINLPSSKSEGSEFDASLLQIADVQKK